LTNNRIGPSGLQHICSSLTLNKSIKILDIRDNDLITDESLKMVLAMLLRNSHLMNIKYSVANEENIAKVKLFNEQKHLSIEELE